MYPILFSTPWFNVYSYGFMLSVGYAVGILIAVYQGKKSGISGEFIFDLMLLQLVVGIIGSRLLFILEYTPNKLMSLEFFAFEQGGMTFYGSVIIAFIFDLIYLKQKQMPFWATMDCIGLCMGPAIAIGRIGCFLNGCCYGTSCSQQIGFRFYSTGEGYFHATQLYESFLALFAFLIICFFKKKQSHHGQIFLSFICLYGFFRFFIEFIRAENPIFLFGMTLSQFLSIIFISVSVFLWRLNSKNRALQLLPDMEEKKINN